ncbi:MAG: BRO family protein [Humidesulfovibrio sp.]|nr:BRO family protein [Humidesulfovibrio sp.]
MNTPKNPGSNPMFSFEGHDVRVVTIQDKLWFVAIDALRCLYPGFNSARGVTNYLYGVDSDERQLATRGGTPGLFEGTLGCGRMALISESGLYKLILRAHPNANPAAKRFQNWVTREVLPALRQDGMYVMGEEKVKTGEMSLDELITKGYEALLIKNSRLSVELAESKAVVQNNLLNLTVQEWLDNNSHYGFGGVAQQLGKKATKLALARGFKLTQEDRVIPHPKWRGQTLETEVNVYPLHILDEVGLGMGLSVSMKVAR